MNGMPWTEKELETLRRLYPNNTSSVVAVILKRDVSSINGKARTLGLQKSEHHKEVTLKKLASQQAQHPELVAHRFPKGHVPANKGMKGVHAPGSEKGWFPKRHLPANTLHDGAITIRVDHKDRKGRKQKWIRLKKAKWQELQRYNWEKKYGKIPKGMVLRCKSEDTLNCDPANWTMITKSENRELNKNYEKSSETRKRTYYKPMKDLDEDKRIAFYLYPRDRKKQKAVLKNKRLLEIKRLELKLKRTIKNATDSK
jgi:hypothetical protein